MKSMQTNLLKAKNVHQRWMWGMGLLLLVLPLSSWQSENDPKLTDEQYAVINAIFKENSMLYFETSYIKSWVNLINEDWLKESYSLIFELPIKEDEMIKEVTNIKFINELRAFLSSHYLPMIIEQNRVKVQVSLEDKFGNMTRISPPFIFGNQALFFYQSVTSESIYYLKKNEKGDWEIMAVYFIYIIMK